MRRLAQGTVSLGALALLLVLFDRTGHGTHWSWCGRRHLGEVVAKMAGRDRPYSVRQVSRWLLELTAAGWIVSRRRWNDTAVRRLSDKLLAALAKLAGKRWRPGRTTTDPARPAAVEAVWDLDENGNAVRVERGPPAG